MMLYFHGQGNRTYKITIRVPPVPVLLEKSNTFMFMIIPQCVLSLFLLWIYCAGAIIIQVQVI
uniref:Uncharacterized protein n=1 Tax=Anguilla anguilla TaxID=7936 RepID=A0A0E9WFR2_ANGAN